MFTNRRFAALLAAMALVAACGDDDNGGGATTAAPTTSQAVTTTTVEAVTTTAPAGLEQPALWPAADVVFEAPEDAAADFVQQVLGVPPVLGEFQQGDSRSGEIAVMSPGEGGTAVARGTLFLRQLGPSNGWFVIGAGSDVQTIDSPATMAVVPAAPLTVTGQAMGFEATVIIEAIAAGDATPLDREVVMAGSMGTAGPYTVSLDLSGAAPGTMVGIIVQGTVGLETDPGDFTAIVVTVAS